MKNTGMTRPLDQLGRIVIPIEIRNTTGIEIGDPLEFYMDQEKIFLGIGKYNGVSCRLCNAAQDLSYFKNSLLCRQCILEMKGKKGVTLVPVPAVKKKPKKSRVHRPTLQLLKNLKQLIREHPEAKQSEYANWLGVSQGRISQLKKLL
ncbi:regulator (plasmid) [Paenibacillus polymyxa]|uniref:Transition state transcriptional regulatory protein abrb n=1 Tax=Paenibacillus polymyxa TaxID=1406 RepID=A0A379LUY6_PAEPO|nr:AbrB/MazE/SpoVT family DNA-binding domain-containing protein [Paenibacillus polymyxa]MBE7901091.1 regulator [Paenibacillus polymyxa]MBG9764540.1 regulator [Paenibacillus polymyxa]MCC3261675.1 AbrB/MazE/SpoVT family DNA-binding domain-containing protein [Paenibacillus polymyxa]QPK56316.1 regulator [Paenibacillus polymyxa]QPK61333.1 regulator [Paenibacillus polymyxa]